MAGKSIAKSGTQAPMGGKKKKGYASTNFWLLVMGLMILAVGLPSLMILGLGMMPTVVAFIVDRSRQKYATFCVGGMNMCGVFPSMMTLWTSTHSISSAATILADPYALLVMYGAAAFGWMLYVAVPPVVSTFLTVMSQRRTAQLRATQKRILQEFGEDIAVAVKGRMKK